MKNDTPRTNAEVFTYDTSTGDVSDECVPAAFARKLEREIFILKRTKPEGCSDAEWNEIQATALHDASA